VHLAWRKSEKELANVAYLMGADRTGKLSRAFGVYDEDTGHALRGTFLLNPEGVLLATETNWYNFGRNVDELMRKFKASLYLSKKTNEACPSKWKDEGDKTLVDPGAKMVGRVHEALG
jgi:alkyl hydroperoxide reductase subunit AhpC